MSESFVCPLSSYGVLAVAGPEASRLLQGQLSCDLNELDAGGFRLGVCCSVQGRILAQFYLTRWQEQWLLLLPRSTLAILQQQLNKFVPLYRGKAQLTDRTDQFQLYGSLHQSIESDATHLRLELSQGRQLYLFNQEPALPQSLAPEAAWQLELLRQGEAMIVGETSGQLLPQQINLAQIGGISFTKGCYTGQEIIARMHYRGQLKRHLYRFQLPLDTQVQIGQPLLALDDDKQVGTVVNHQRYRDEHLVLIECLDQYRHHCRLENGTQPALLELPYSLGLAE